MKEYKKFDTTLTFNDDLEVETLYQTIINDLSFSKVMKLLRMLEADIEFVKVWEDKEQE